MTLRDQIAADVSVFLNKDDFAEDCEFIQKGGEKRTIVAIVDEDSQVVETRDGVFVQDTLSAFVSRDSATGIDALQLGDGLRLVRDPDDKVYAWDGQNGDGDEFMWTVRFIRMSPYELGGNRRR
jgi:hypothetical protein